MVGPEPSLQTHPRVAVDAVLFTIADRELKTLLVKIKKGPFFGRWAFPGGLVQVGESLDEAARRELHEKTGVWDTWSSAVVERVMNKPLEELRQASSARPD